jgi:hypothetical protein
MMTAVMVRAPVLVILAATLASCMPVPHVAHLRPAVTGTIVEQGKPVPGVALFLAKFPGTNRPCTEAGEVIPVTPDGSFSWSSDEEFKLADSMINPVKVRGALTVLCIRHPDKGVLIGATMFMKQDAPLSLRLLCDVAYPHGGVGPHIASTILGEAQYCTAIGSGH